MISPALPSLTAKIHCPEGTVYLRLAWEGDAAKHVYIHVGKGGGAMQALADALSRLASELLKRGLTLTDLATLLGDISHDRSNGSYVAKSVPDAVAYGVRLIEKTNE